jgi:hypothetical protein
MFVLKTDFRTHKLISRPLLLFQIVWTKFSDEVKCRLYMTMNRQKPFPTFRLSIDELDNNVSDYCSIGAVYI